MDGKTIQCLPNPLQYVLIYLQWFPSYTMLKSMRKSKNRYFYHIFVFPGDARGAITLSIVWMKREFDAYKLSRSMYPSTTVSQLFELKCKKSPFSRIAAHIFVFTGDAPATITQYVSRTERQFNACQTPRNKYLSIFNSFRVIRCLSQCVSSKIAIFTTFLFPLGTPQGQSH